MCGVGRKCALMCESAIASQRHHVFLIFQRLALFLVQAWCIGFLAGCAAPQPFDYGNPTAPPEGCIEATERGLKCSLQSALDEVHARFIYQSDTEQYPLESRPGRGSDYWTLLPESGRGDCEDFAMTLRWLLNSRGVTGTHLMLVRTDGYKHVALEKDGWLMDNLHARPFRRQDVDWEFLIAGDEDGVWRWVN